MDVINTVRTCVGTWNSGGETECRNMLIAPHCNPSDPGCLNVLTTAYNTLLSYTLVTWSSKQTLTADAFVSFIRSILDNLPSTSSSSATSNTAVFGEHIVDLLWSIDVELDETLADVKATITSCGEQSADKQQPILAKANKVKQNAEADKATLVSILSKLLDFGVVNPTFCRERLDTTMAEGAGLFVKNVIEKKEIRLRTGLFYKQNKFNLLREQSEGYSKLTVELTNALGIGHSPLTARPSESLETIQHRACLVWEKIISLIGFFDLDPNKALDIILDVMSSNLASHYTFFLALLSFSPWARPLRLQHEDQISTDAFPGRFHGKTLDEILNLASPSFSSGDMPHGSRVLAQILGFKFNYYQSPEAPDPPKSLYLAAALLIREGFVALEDLYPHLSPVDSEMENVRLAFMKDVKSRIASAKMSQLAMAAPLESTMSSAPMSTKVKATITSDVKAPEPKILPNQKAGLLMALLSVGALKPAIAIVSRFPWMVDAQPEIADLFIRILKHSISLLYESLVAKEYNPDFVQPRSRFGATGVAPPPPRKPVLSLWAPTPPSTSTTEFVFFFPDWIEQVPICTGLEDLLDVVEPFMRFIGPHISRDPLFLTKFVRLGRQQILATVINDPITNKPIGEPDQEHPVQQSWYRVTRQYLFPALPLIRGNAVCIVEVWNILRLFDIELRWKLYGEWRSEMYKSHPELRIRQVQADRESKGILRRLSHKTIDSLSGPLAKLAHSNPCILFSNAVNQIMAYDNLASVVVQALKNVTNMGFEVLIFTILDALANPHKERVKDDGVNTSDWLQSLASFIGMLFRRYNTSLHPVLTYINHQLQNGQTTEIVVLRELIWKMAGIEPLPSLSDSQIQAMAGGPALRIESIASSTRGARVDPGEPTRGNPPRALGQSLTETSLALPLLIQVAQQRQSSVFSARDAHLKSLAGLFDTTHGVLLQYLELLTTPSAVSPEDYANKILPPLRDLHEKYGISAPVCMQIVRPVLHTQLLNSALSMEEQERLANQEAERRLKAALTAKREPSISQSRVASPLPNSVTESSSESKLASDTHTALEDVPLEADGHGLAAPESPWLPQLEVLFEDVQTILPSQAHNILGPGFYVTFWQLSTYDLSPPLSRYDEEVAALRALSRQEDGLYVACERSADRAKRSMASWHRTRRERFNSFISTLTQESKEQITSRVFTLKRLAREKQHWFTAVTNAAQKQTQALKLLDTFLEHCVHPRSLLSPMDADFCAQFIKMLHTQGTPGFHTLACYDKILGDQIKVVLFSCSEYEARNYGRFLLGILSDLNKWHSDEATYIADNRSKAGGKTVLHTGFQSQYRLPMPPENQLKWSVFQKIVRKWHKKIALAFVECVQTGEFMHVYNAIIVLKEILPFFPLSAVSQETGPQLDKIMDQFLEKEERGDLKILGRAYSASLKKREQFWTSIKVPTKPAATTSRPIAPSRSSATPVGPSAQTVPGGSDIKRPPQVASSTPSAPRAQLASKPQPVPEKSNISAAMESVPRPPVVKRIRPEASNSPKPAAEKPSISEHASERKDDSKESSQLSNLRAEARTVPSSPMDPTRGERSAENPAPAMPPPSEPSQKPSALELRVTAHHNRSDKNDDKNDPSRGMDVSAAPSPRRRSVSPSSRPGTRNHSSESRTSAGRSRGNADASDKKDREPTRRDSLTHNRSDRGGRERTTTGDSDRDRESRRDRHGDKERDRGDRERERDKDRDREKDRDRHGDRHRRDEKTHNRDARKEREGEAKKDREGEARKDRDGRTHNTENVNSSSIAEDRLPPRPDARHRDTPDDGLGKRRRGPEDEVDRGSKRSSRKDTHREDRSRRPGDKNEHPDRPRESDRRRRGGEVDKNDGRDNPLDKAESKRPPDAPQNDTRRPDAPPRNPEFDAPVKSGTKVSPLRTPSAPRAMSFSETPRNGGKNNGRRDGLTGSNTVPISPIEGGLGGGGSLRSRISDKETTSRQPSYHGQSRNDRDSRKRPLDREKDALDTSNQGPEQSSNKRLKLNRNRYTGESASIAKKTLPINPQAVDRLQGRKD
ncbi:transcription factor/nuclear export subunit protein 2-domain-containing protein [Rhodocollybia butyracea]|uniref:THO complex subunit 2 n=1 Tax=Rhodocollybia butyracea TaxID=206335 RepID=A0A9P5QA05_9AGAR|nr:transcription factor/nuclear export subunit protein 2-domain-containing protein [Rhodocollybia butyracea]